LAKLYPGIPFSPPTTLTENIGAADTIIKVADASVFPPAPNYATIGTDEGGETIEYAAKADGLLSGCTRGVEGTAKTWQKGEVIARNFTKTDQDDLITGIEAAQTTATAAATAADNAQQTANRAASAAEAAQSTADAALPKSGGVVTGLIEGGLDFQSQIYLRRIAGAERLNLARYKTENDVSILDVRSSNNDYPAELGSSAIFVDGVQTPLNNYEAANKLYVDSSVIRPNLLDNWYFVNPVNQRGQATYDASNTMSYCIDRWRAENSTVALGTGHITIHGTNTYGLIRQAVEHPEQFSGLTMTISCLYSDSDNLAGTYMAPYDSSQEYWMNRVEDKNLQYMTFTVTSNNTVLGVLIVTSNLADKTINPIACKLEIGSTQTLAHKDASGNWVLNEIPDYGSELLKCQRYFVSAQYSRLPTFISNYDNNCTLWVNIPLSVPMRATPSASVTNNPIWISHPAQMYDAASSQGFKSVLVNSDIGINTPCLGLTMFLNKDLTNYTNSSGCISYLGLEFSADL